MTIYTLYEIMCDKEAQCSTIGMTHNHKSPERTAVSLYWVLFQLKRTKQTPATMYRSPIETVSYQVLTAVLEQVDGSNINVNEQKEILYQSTPYGGACQFVATAKSFTEMLSSLILGLIVVTFSRQTTALCFSSGIITWKPDGNNATKVTNVFLL